MEEKLISYETAILAEEKGFNEYVSYKWVKYINDEILFDYRKNEDFKSVDAGTIRLESVTLTQETSVKTYKAPTQSLLQRWLREKHNIDITINPMLTTLDKRRCYFNVISNHEMKEIGDWQEDYGNILDKSHQDVEGNFVNDELHDKFIFEDKFCFNSYEDALESGLQKALKSIKLI